MTAAGAWVRGGADHGRSGSTPGVGGTRPAAELASRFPALRRRRGARPRRSRAEPGAGAVADALATPAARPARAPASYQQRSRCRASTGGERRGRAAARVRRACFHRRGASSTDPTAACRARSRAAHARRIAGADSASFSAISGFTTSPSSESSVSTSTSSSSMSGIVSDRRSGRLPQVTTASTGVPGLRASAIARFTSGDEERDERIALQQPRLAAARADRRIPRERVRVEQLAGRTTTIATPPRLIASQHVEPSPRDVFSRASAASALHGDTTRSTRKPAPRQRLEQRLDGGVPAARAVGQSPHDDAAAARQLQRSARLPQRERERLDRRETPRDRAFRRRAGAPRRARTEVRANAQMSAPSSTAVMLPLMTVGSSH